MADVWQCKDYADGWITFETEQEAIEYQAETGCLMRKVEQRVSYNRLIEAIERFVDEIGIDPENYEVFCMGVLRLLHTLPVDQFKWSKP